MYMRTVRDDMSDEMKAKKKLFDAGVKPNQLADYNTFRGVHLFAHGILCVITKLDIDWYNNTYRIGVNANVS